MISDCKLRTIWTVSQNLDPFFPTGERYNFLRQSSRALSDCQSSIVNPHSNVIRSGTDVNCSRTLIRWEQAQSRRSTDSLLNAGDLIDYSLTNDLIGGWVKTEDVVIITGRNDESCFGTDGETPCFPRGVTVDDFLDIISFDAENAPVTSSHNYLSILEIDGSCVRPDIVCLLDGK